MPAPNLPPLPAGFVIDGQTSGTPPLPPGFTLDAPGGAPPAAPQAAAAPEPYRLGDHVRGYLKSILGETVGDGPAAVITGRPEDEILSAQLSELRSRPNTPEPSVLQRAGRYVGEYGRGIADAASKIRPGEEVAGGLEAIASLATGAVAPFSAAASTLVGNREVGPEEFTYQPRTQTGRAALDLVGAVAKPITDSSLDVALGPLAMEAGNIGQRVKPAPSAPRTSTVGAAAASASPQTAAMSGASDALQSAVSRVYAKGGKVNQAVLDRKVDAETLPVPMRITEGQATGDPIKISNERNLRAKEESYARTFNEQNKGLVDNLTAVREEAGQNVFSTNPVEHGDTLIRTYQAKDAAAEAQIGAKYKALRDANGGQFPIDASLLLDNAVQNLHQQLLVDHAPKGPMATLRRLSKSGKMTFENFESLRTNLARIQRSLSADGNEKAAAAVIRQAMEELPMRTVESAENLLSTEGVGSAAAQKLVNQQYRFTRLKRLADDARTAARQHFQELEADPAYDAAVNGTVPPDRFVQKFIVNGDRDNLATMRKNLADSAEATETMSVSAIDHLRQQAGIDSSGNGNFSQARYNKALETLGPKLQYLLDPKSAETLQKIGRVARSVMEQPAGSFVNNSNTLTASIGKGIGSTLEVAANVAAGGVPVGTIGRFFVEHGSKRQRALNTLKPGAGLEYVPPPVGNALAPANRPRNALNRP